MRKTYKELVEREFGTQIAAMKAFNTTRKTIRKFMDANKLTPRIKNKIIAAGYSITTFKKV